MDRPPTEIYAGSLAGGSVCVKETALALAFWFLWRRRTLDAVTVPISLLGAPALNLVLKLLFARPQPALSPPLVVGTPVELLFIRAQVRDSPCV